MNSRVGVAILARAPIPGQAKTRLIPALGAAHLRKTARALSDNDAVVIPVEDGGYVLIGMQRPAAELFAGIDWGSERVMSQTRQRLATMGWQWSEPDLLWDVDLPRDLERLYARYPESMAIQSNAGGPCE